MGRGPNDLASIALRRRNSLPQDCGIVQLVRHPTGHAPPLVMLWEMKVDERPPTVAMTGADRARGLA